MFAYYQKLSPEKKLTPADSRFIIHKHVMTGQWQLTEVYNHFWTKNIKAFPVTEENENNAFQNKLNNQFVIFLFSLIANYAVAYAENDSSTKFVSFILFQFCFFFILKYLPWPIL